jgi:hypothetical protein
MYTSDCTSVAVHLHIALASMLLGLQQLQCNSSSTTIIIWVETSYDVLMSKSNRVNTTFDEETETDAVSIISYSPGPSSYYISLATSQGLLPTALSSTCTRY